MFQGNWKCATCGAAITELPFEPRSTEGLQCRDCHSKGRGSASSTPKPQGERKMFEGDWKCSNCGTAITSLPFAPRNTDGLLCVDCFKKSKS